MYPLGLLFGLGFDTATEVGLLALAAGVATDTVPLLGILSLPVLFAAGMGMMDTLDGAFMAGACVWAFSNPVRKVYYNITVTSLSILVALAIGTVELLQVLSARLALSGGFWDWLNGLDFETLGMPWWRSSCSCSGVSLDLEAAPDRGSLGPVVEPADANWRSSRMSIAGVSGTIPGSVSSYPA
jgi:hypothetical protein